MDAAGQSGSELPGPARQGLWAAGRGRRLHAQKGIVMRGVAYQFGRTAGIERRDVRAGIDAEMAARPVEKGGRGGLDPNRYGDWEIKGITADF